MRPPSAPRSSRRPTLTLNPDLKEEDVANTGPLFRREESGSPLPDDRIDATLDASMEEDALRFMELPVETLGGRRRRLLAQFAENTHRLDAWLRRAEQSAVPLREPSAEEYSWRPRRLRGSRGSGRTFRVLGPVRQGFGIRKPRNHVTCVDEDLLLSREEHEMMMQWEDRWQAQELEQREEFLQGGEDCPTPSFGFEASPHEVPKKMSHSETLEEDEFAAEVRAICGDTSVELGPPVAPREAKPRVTVVGQPPLEEESVKESMSREERLMRFCPEAVNPAFSSEIQQVLQKSLVRGASKVLAEHRGHQMNWERLKKTGAVEERPDDQRALRQALHLHARTQHWRRSRYRGCLATPPLRGSMLRPGSCSIRQSPDFTQLRQELPSKAELIARKRRKRSTGSRQVEMRGPSRESISRANSPRLFEPVLCSPECRNWRSKSPIQQQFEREEEHIIVGSQWRDLLQELRQERRHPCQLKSRHLGQQSEEQTVDRMVSRMKSRELQENGKLEDCPDAHALHLVREGRLEALERWGGLRFVRLSMQRQLLFYTVRHGSVQMLQWLLEELGRNHHPEALHWREQGGRTSTLLHAAAEVDMLAMCVLLEELGADLEATNEKGQQAWQVAGPFCQEIFKLYGSFRMEDKSPSNWMTTLRTGETEGFGESMMRRPP